MLATIAKEPLYSVINNTVVLLVDSTSSPCYVFAELQDDGLIAEFGTGITVKTDFEKRLSKRDDYPALVELRQSIFMAVKLLPEFVAARYKMELRKKINPEFLKFKTN